MSTNTAVLDRLRQQRDEARDAAIAIAEAEDFNPEQPGPLPELEERAVGLDRQIERLAALQQQRAAADQLDGRLAKAAQTRAEQVSPVAAGLTWGDAFVRSEEFGNYRGRGTSGQFELDAPVQHRALPTGLADLIAAGLTPTKTTVDTTPPPAPTPLLDNINRVQVAGNAIEFVSWQKVAGGAAVVAEKGPKPSGEWAPTVTPDVLDTIAVYTQLTRQLIEDMPAVRDYINGELQRDVLRAEEAGAAAALAAATLTGVTAGDLLGSIRVGIATVQEEGYSPNAVLLNPADWADLDNIVMGATLNGPVIRQNFWGLTPIPSSAQAQGEAVVGDFRAGVTQFYRSAVALYITDSHADTFLSNVFTLLAERRAKSVVVRPQALVECTVAVVP
jgi:hypothetical protein